MDGFVALYIFMLAAFTGYEIIGRVPVILHTPLMSGSNVVHGIVMIGAMVVLGHADTTAEKVIGFLAVAQRQFRHPERAAFDAGEERVQRGRRRRCRGLRRRHGDTGGGAGMRRYNAGGAGGGGHLGLRTGALPGTRSRRAG